MASSGSTEVAPEYVQVGWVSSSGLLYSDAQKHDNPHVQLDPVYKRMRDPKQG